MWKEQQADRNHPYENQSHMLLATFHASMHAPDEENQACHFASGCDIL